MGTIFLGMIVPIRYGTWLNEIEVRMATDKFQWLADDLSNTENKSYRRYDLKVVEGRLMLTRDEICRAFEIAIAKAFGTSVERDDHDGTFL